MLRMPRRVLLGLMALTVLRLLFAARTPLGDDEAFYWEWSRHLSAGYVDHPPAIAFIISVVTHLWGSSPLTVRSSAVALSLATSLALWVLAREVLGTETGATWSVVLFNLIPVFSAGALLAAPDAPLGLCWMLALLWAWRAGRRDVPGRGDWGVPSTGTGEAGPPPVRAWLAAGAWVGLGLLSKYTAVALPVGIAVWLALSPERRLWLRRPEPYCGLALAGLFFMPVFWWNASHHWASFSFTVLGRPSWSKGGNFPEFLAFQLVYLAPLMLAALLWAVVEAARRGLAGARRSGPAEVRLTEDPKGRDRWLFLAATSVPVIASMLVASLFGHIKGHWPAPGYIAATVALAGIAAEHPWPVRPLAWRTAALGVLGTTVLVTVLVYALPEAAPVLLPPRLDPTLDYYGWSAAAPRIAAVAERDAHGPYFVTSDRYQVLAQFDFATRGRYLARTITGADQYDLWTRWSDLRGEDALFIQDGRYPPEVDLASGCRSVQTEPAIPIVRRGRVVRSLGLAWCRGFLGHPIHPGMARSPGTGRL